MLRDLLKEYKMSIYELSKKSQIPYSTLNDLVNEKKDLDHCSVKLLKQLASIFHMSMDHFYLECKKYTLADFENFKSNVCHDLKDKGRKDYLIHLLTSDVIMEYWENGQHAQSLYLLGMADYLSKLCEVPLCDKFDSIRNTKLEEMIYPSAAFLDETRKAYCIEHAIPEFLKYGIVEGEVFDAI